MKKKATEKDKLKRVSNIMLIVSVFMITWYTIVSIILQFKTSIEISSTLTTCWYAFWTVEIFSLAGIKISKVKHADILQKEEEVDEDGMVG